MIGFRAPSALGEDTSSSKEQVTPSPDRTSGWHCCLGVCHFTVIMEEGVKTVHFKRLRINCSFDQIKKKKIGGIVSPE